MASIEELRDARMKKIELLKNAGMDPYPVSLSCDYSISLIKSKFKELEKS